MDQEVSEGSTAATPTAQTKDGYTFDGWYSDDQYTAAWEILHCRHDGRMNISYKAEFPW